MIKFTGSGFVALIASLGFFVPTAVIAQSENPSERPNIVLIITDDQNDYFEKQHGMNAITPALDRFRSQAIVFPKTYCASPVCGPSRAALFSGLYPHHTGAYLNGADPWQKSQQLIAAETLPELFQRSGYETWGMGKLFHAKLTNDRKDKQWNNKASANGGFGPFPQKEFQFAGKFFGVQEWDQPDREFPDVKSADAAIKFLENRKSDQPLFMVYGLWRPHTPFTAPRRFFDQYKVDNITFPPPGFDENDLSDLPDGGQHLAAIFGDRWKQFGESNPQAWRRILHGYLACTTFADWNVGRVIEAVDKHGYGDNTIVIVTSDNGFHIGEKSHYGKSTLWEQAAKVPMMIRLPQNRHAGIQCDANVGLIDLYPTLRNQCRLEVPPQKLDGKDLSPLFMDPRSKWNHAAVTTYGEGRFSLRSGPWRYIRYSDGSEELYDHREDPYEKDNLATKNETAEIRKKFRKQIPDHWVKSLGGRKG